MEITLPTVRHHYLGEYGGTRYCAFFWKKVGARNPIGFVLPYYYRVPVPGYILYFFANVILVVVGTNTTPHSRTTYFLCPTLWCEANNLLYSCSAFFLAISARCSLILALLLFNLARSCASNSILSRRSLSRR